MMIKYIKRYLDKNLFYVSVFLTGLTSFLFGIFYTFFKDSVFKNASSSFLENSGILGAYVTTSTSKPDGVNYFLILLVLSLLFFFLISFCLKKYLNKSYSVIFNLISLLNIVLIIGLILSILCVQELWITYVILIVFALFYLCILYRALDKLFNLNFKNKLLALVIFILPVIIILIFLKLFV